MNHIDIIKETELGEKGPICFVKWLIFICVALFAWDAWGNEAQELHHNLLIPLGILLADALACSLLPDRVAKKFLTHWCTFFFDTVIIAWAIYALFGWNAPQIYILYFVAMLIGATSRTVAATLMLTVVLALIYGTLLVRQDGWEDMLRTDVLLSFPFFFVSAFSTTLISQQSRALATLSREAADVEAQFEMGRQVQNSMLPPRAAEFE